MSAGSAAQGKNGPVQKPTLGTCAYDERFHCSVVKPAGKLDMRHLMILGLAASVLGGCAERAGGAMTGPMGSTASPGAMTSPPAAEFVRMAGASDLYEIQSSQAVLQTTQDPAIRRFAQMMAEHHTQTTASVTAAARAAGMVPPPPVLDDRKREMLHALQQAQGQDRDAVYLRQQVTAHEEALALHTAYAESGDTPQLKAAAASARPIVARHLEEIRGLDSQGASAAAIQP